MSGLAKILIVDDSAPMRRAIRCVLEGLAAEILECSNGFEALIHYAAHLPDWVLMDIRMKGTSGLTTIKQLKKAFPDARIIVVTGNRGDDLREAAFVAGACAYVVKDNLFNLRHILVDRGLGPKTEPVVSC